jgi:hypothetical protein
VSVTREAKQRLRQTRLGEVAAQRRRGRRQRAARSQLSGQEFERKLVWVFGSPRSGSSWLLQLLGAHETVVTINEPLLGQYLGPFLCDLPGVSAPALDAENFTLRRIKRENNSHFFAEQFSDVWAPGLGALMRERFLAHVVRSPAKAPVSQTLVVIKEPNGSQSADVIMRALPSSRLLFLLRDGRDVVDSELAGNLPGSWITKEFPGAQGLPPDDRHAFVVQSAYKWLWRTEVVQEAFAKHRGPKMLVRYEDLRTAPTQQFGAILDWLGLKMAPSRLASLTEEHSFERLPADARGPQAFSRAASPGQWRENLSSDEQAAVEQILAPKLKELGYEV